MTSDGGEISKKASNSQRSLPLIDDPVISVAVRQSVAKLRASSLHNLPITDTKESTEQKHPFHRWLTKLRKRNIKRKKEVHPRQQRWRLDEFEDDPPSLSSSKVPPRASLKHRKSSSWASGSTALLAASRSAFASLSIISDTRQSAHDGSGFRPPRSRRSERASASLDIDTEALFERARKRRETIEELLHTETEYILSLRALNQLYSSMCLTIAEPLKSDMEQMRLILGKLADLHHELAHALKSIRSPDRAAAEPNEAAEVALVFGRLLNRFFLYEEYASKYEEMLHHVGLASQNIPNWENYQRGFETLTNSTNPAPRGGLGRNKSLTFGDLHIKPIQRLCKYPLIFADLCKYTPVIDGPVEHLEIEKVLYRWRDTVMEINQATIDDTARERIQHSWKLQDMLVLPDPLMAPYMLRCLGQTELCGALYIAYQSGKSITGSFMLCALFKTYLVLASPIKQDGIRKYKVAANIALSSIEIRDMDGELGLQCPTTPYAWKIVFEIDSSISEILVVATSVNEQERWKHTIQETINKNVATNDQFSMVTLDISSIGAVIGKPGSLLRSIAMDDTKLPKHQVVIRHTVSECSGNIPLSIRERVIHPVLTPRRGDRARIEEDLERAGCKAASKEQLLPKGRALRASASTLFRKLSRSSRLQENRPT